MQSAALGTILPQCVQVHEEVDNFVGAEKTCHTRLGSQNELQPHSDQNVRPARTYIKYDYELPPFSLRKVARVIEYQGLQTYGRPVPCGKTCVLCASSPGPSPCLS